MINDDYFITPIYFQIADPRLDLLTNPLKSTEKNPIPFDFIIENEFLRTSLEVWLRRNNKTEVIVKRFSRSDH